MRGDYMKVFISWSGETSLKVAQIFREWIPSVIQSIEPYVSSEDIDKGARWSTDIAKELADSSFGILCVTKDNLQAPWLSFEAGALSKTMEKSFVTPFLFNIKRSEVNGPILQFQSTIFEKEDIRRMVKTLNKACGEASISEARLDKAFDVWYPTLESLLTELKESASNVDEEQESNESNETSEILEEILELSRDNQKLLKSPDMRLYEDICRLQEAIDQLSIRNNSIYNKRIASRKYSAVFLDEIMHMTEGRGNYGFLLLLSLYKEDFPWIYDMGKELYELLKSSIPSIDKDMAIRNFREMLDFSFGHPIMRESFGRSKDMAFLANDVAYALNHCLDNLHNKYC